MGSAKNRCSVFRAGSAVAETKEPELNQAVARNWLWNRFGGKGVEPEKNQLSTRKAQERLLNRNRFGLLAVGKPLKSTGV